MGAALGAGVNDLGGTLMNESISRAALAPSTGKSYPAGDGGADPGERPHPRQRTTLYADAPPDRRAASFTAAPLSEPSNPPVREAGLKAPPHLVRPGLLARAR